MNSVVALVVNFITANCTNVLLLYIKHGYTFFSPVTVPGREEDEGPEPSPPEPFEWSEDM